MSIKDTWLDRSHFLQICYKRRRMKILLIIYLWNYHEELHNIYMHYLTPRCFGGSNRGSVSIYLKLSPELILLSAPPVREKEGSSLWRPPRPPPPWAPSSSAGFRRPPPRVWPGVRGTPEWWSRLTSSLQSLLDSFNCSSVLLTRRP